MGNLLDEIPGYREAIAREGFNRDAAFLDLTETVGGVELRPMTLLDFLRLDLAKSPFLHGGIPDAADVGAFLWALSENYNAKDVRGRRKFLKGIRKLRFAEIVLAIETYIDDTLADSPGGHGIAGIPATSWLASMVDSLAVEYGWSESAILNLPIKRVFQYQRRIALRRQPTATLFNASDRVRGKWLEELNRGAN